MGEVTNRVPLDEARDILERPGRACAGFIVNGRPHIEPVAMRHRDGRFLLGIDDDAPQPAETAEVVLVVDEGVLFFDLRAVYVRGTPSPATGPEDRGHRWYELDPGLVACWDYGRLRVTDAGA